MSPASPVTVSLPEPVRTFSKPAIVSLPQPVSCAVSVARLTVTAVAPVNSNVSVPAPPVRVSLPSPPRRFSMLRRLAIAAPATLAVPSAAPFSVAVTAAVKPAKDAVSDPSPPSSRSETPAVVAPGLSVSSPAPPDRTFSAALPVSVSLNAEPSRFSNPLSVSMPAAPVFCAEPCNARLTVTPAAAPA